MSWLSDLNERRMRFKELRHPKWWHCHERQKPLSGRVWRWHGAIPWWAWERVAASKEEK